MSRMKIMFSTVIAFFLLSNFSLADISDDLDKAISMNDTAQVIRLVKSGANVNVNVMTSAIFWGALNDNEEIVKVLIKAGYDVDSRDSLNRTALLFATEIGAADFAKIFLRAGANINARNKEGKTAIMLAAYKGLDTLVSALLDAGADLYARDEDGKNAIMLAAFTGRYTLVRMFLEAGCELNDVNSLINAAAGGNIEILNIVLRSGIDVNSQTEYGSTALIAAAHRGHAKMIKYLLQIGANAKLQDRYGHNALYHLKFSKMSQSEKDQIADLLWDAM